MVDFYERMNELANASVYECVYFDKCDIDTLSTFSSRAREAHTHLSAHTQTHTERDTRGEAILEHLKLNTAPSTRIHWRRDKMK